MVAAKPSAIHEQDSRLMQLVAAGDPRARKALAVRVVGPTRRIAHALMPAGSAGADDAAQVALCEILKSAGSYKGTASLERWCRRITVRVVLRECRRAAKHGRVVDASTDPDTLRAVFGDALLAEALPKPLTAYLDALQPDQRQTLVLRHALGHSAKEISEMLERPLSTVKYQISTAITSIRKAIRRDLARGTGGGQ